MIFGDLPAAVQNKIKEEYLQSDPDMSNDELVKKTFQKGKYSMEQVDTWYSRSKRYILSFTMSIVWIGLTTWAMVKCAEKLGCHLSVGSFTMGLVVLAAGTSIPDTLASMDVASKGEGDMAVANAIGSNVFNIFLGIGLPMLIYELIWKEPFVVQDPLQVLVSSSMLVIITIIMYIALWSSKWVLTKKLSAALMSLFVLYIALNILFESGSIPFYQNICSSDPRSPFSCNYIVQITGEDIVPIE